MPFEIVRNDITNMCVDAVVNTANPRPVIGPGTDSMIHEKGGSELLTARQQIGNIDMGYAEITPAFNLQANFVIHTVGPVWVDGGYDEMAILHKCYENSLRLALEHNCQSIAFPLIATGNYGFPKDKALQIVISAFSSFLLEHDMQIYLVVFDRDSFKLSEKLFQRVASYIDENYAEKYAVAEQLHPYAQRRRRDTEIGTCSASYPCAPMAESKSAGLEKILKQADAGFTETLLRLIDKTGKKDSEIYKKANLSKQHFPKIRNNPNYQPTKQMAIALALALELNLEETKDLIGRAGYAMTNSSKFDLIIRYFIEHGNYNIIEINIALYEFDQPLLGT